MNRYIKALFHPGEAVFYLLSRYRPRLLWRRYSRLAERAGFKKLYLALSFDCDTPEDAKVVLDFDQRLRDLGVKPIYAVPGAILEKNEKEYSELHLRGAEFLNHGYEQHTFWNEGLSRYESCFFYDQLPLERVRQDVEEGHMALKKVLGVTPPGFRTPHFGTFQTTTQLTFLYSVLETLGYKYSSSTAPFYAFWDGPAFNRFGLLEFPVSGTFSRPLDIQDSWGFYAAPNRRWGPEDFLAETKALVRCCREEKMGGILNYYADPSHVWDQPTFFEAVKLMREVAEPVKLEVLCPEVQL
ncbi:MAG: polysaccharide deacetylase family protein [bacterium]|nr:polysaccharide deacetylase family protein [bacterium]